jgi:hypothetical protein
VQAPSRRRPRIPPRWWTPSVATTGLIPFAVILAMSVVLLPRLRGAFPWALSPLSGTRAPSKATYIHSGTRASHFARTAR